MTAKFSTNLPLRNMLRVVNQGKKLTIVMCILQLLGIPLIMAAGMLEMVLDTPNRIYFDGEPYEMLGMIFLAVSVFMGMFVAINSFTELYSKSKVDMLYALPLTGKQRFFSNYLGGICMYILPYIVSMILGWIIMLVMMPFIQGESYIREMGGFAKYYALFSFGLLVLMLLYYTLTVLVTVCCGTLFESIYTNLLFNFLIPGTMAAVLVVITDHVDLSFEYLWQIIGFTSPIGGLIYLFYMVAENVSLLRYSVGSAVSGSETVAHEMLPSYFRWMLIILVITAVMLIGAWQLYIRRKSEHVGRPFIYIAAYYVMLTALTVALLCVMDNDDMAIPVLLFAAIVYFVMEVIRRRGFRKFWVSVISYAVTVALSVGMFALIVQTNCFGRNYYVPSAAGISSVYIETTNLDQGTMISLEYTNREVISDVIDFHKELIKRKKETPDVLSHEATYDIDKALSDKNLLRIYYTDDWERSDESPFQQDIVKQQGYYDGYGNIIGEFEDGKEHLGYYADSYDFSVTYYTIAGTTIHRSININIDELSELLRIVERSDLYLKALEEHMNEALKRSYSEWSDIAQERIVPANIKMELLYGTGYRSSSISTQTVTVVAGGEAAIEELVAAYCRDMAATTYEERLTAALYGSIYNYPIYENFTETIALLESWGFHAFSVEERYSFVDKENSQNQAANYQSALCVRIYEPGTWSAASLKYPNSTIEEAYVPEAAAYDDVVPLFDTVSMKEGYPELYALLGAAQKHYVSDESCYLVLVNNETCVVPPEYSDLAEAVIKKGSYYGYSRIFGSIPTTVPGNDNFYDDDDYDDIPAGGALVPSTANF